MGDCILALLCAALPWLPRAAKADEVDRLIEALKPSPADDAAWAVKLLSAGRGLSGKPASQARLYEAAYERGIRRPKGYPTAIQAAEALRQARPKERLAWGLKLLSAHKLAVRAADARRKRAAAVVYLDRIEAVADEFSAAEGSAQAARLYAEALTWARRLDRTRTGRIALKLKDAREQQGLQQQLDLCKRQVAENPRNLLAREKLIRLYVAELDLPAEAQKLLTVEVSERLRTYVPLAAQPAEKVAKAALLELGDWYASLAGRATTRGRARSLARAAGCYLRCIELESGLLQVTLVKAKLAKLARLSGTIRAGADDRLWLHINGKEIAKSRGNCRSPGPVKVTLEVGDVIAAKLRNVAPPNRDFHMLFTSEDGSLTFRAGPAWRTYRPKDVEQWWVFQPSKTDPPCKAWGQGGNRIWGRGNPSYVYHVVTVQDLTYAGPPAPPAAETQPSGKP